MCFIFHDWDKWEEKLEHYGSYYLFGKLIETKEGECIIDKYQERKCKKCGLIQKIRL